MKDSTTPEKIEKEEEKKSSEKKEELVMKAQSGEDIDMTDEEEEETRRHIEMMARKRQMRGETDVAVVLGQPDLTKDLANEDLEQLIKASGDDIEYEFYVSGE